MTETEHERLQAARLLAVRLERLSADSHWAHQASGLRGALLRCLEELENPAIFQPNRAEVERLMPILEQLIERGYWILLSAARLIRTPETSDFVLRRSNDLPSQKSYQGE